MPQVRVERHRRSLESAIVVERSEVFQGAVEAFQSVWFAILRCVVHFFQRFEIWQSRSFERGSSLHFSAGAFWEGASICAIRS